MAPAAAKLHFISALLYDCVVPLASNIPASSYSCKSRVLHPVRSTSWPMSFNTLRNIALKRVISQSCMAVRIHVPASCSCCRSRIDGAWLCRPLPPADHLPLLPSFAFPPAVVCCVALQLCPPNLGASADHAGMDEFVLSKPKYRG